MINIELLDQVIAKIKENPHNWNQGQWATASVDGTFADRLNKGEPQQFELNESCGTSFCVAGWVAALGNQPIRWHHQYGWNRFEGKDVIIGYSANYLQNGESIAKYAQKRLGLNWYQAEMLFDENNTLGQIEALRNEFLEEAIEDLIKLRSINQ